MSDLATPAWPDGFARTAAALRDCRLLLLTATRLEAEPLLAALSHAESFLVATKEVTVGRLKPDGGRCPGGLRAAIGVGGCDKTNTAHMLTCLFHAMVSRPALVMQVGIGGAFLGAGSAAASPGDVVLATEEVYADTGSSSPEGWLSAEDLGLPIARVEGRELGNRFELDAALVRAAAAAVEADDGFGSAAAGVAGARVFAGRCLTVSRATGLEREAADLVGRWNGLAESMEGAAAAHICALYRVPFLEVRGISNMVTDRDRASWQLAPAMAAAGRAALAICGAFAGLPLAG